MNRLYMLLFILPALCQGFPSHSEKSKVSSKNVAPVKSEGRQYVSPAQQPQDMVGNQQAYGQYPSGYGTAPTQYGQQQNDQQPQQTTGQQMASTPTNKGHTGILYSHRPVLDHDKDISPPKDKKAKKHKKKFSKSKKHDDDEEK